MKTLIAWAVFAAVALPQTPHQHHPPQNAEEWKHALNDPQRDTWQMPHEVVMALKLKPGEVIADIGAGTGYFAKRFAHHAGKVYAVDIEPGLLDEIKKDAPPNLVTILATPDDPKLPPASVDTIFFCDVLHHIENRPAYYAKLAKALKPGGRIVDIDFYKRPAPVGPPEGMKISDAEIVKEFAAAGFKKTESFDFLPYQYYLVFQKQ